MPLPSFSLPSGQGGAGCERSPRSCGCVLARERMHQGNNLYQGACPSKLQRVGHLSSLTSCEQREEPSSRLSSRGRSETGRAKAPGDAGRHTAARNQAGYRERKGNSDWALGPGAARRGCSRLGPDEQTPAPAVTSRCRHVAPLRCCGVERAGASATGKKSLTVSYRKPWTSPT